MRKLPATGARRGETRRAMGVPAKAVRDARPAFGACSNSGMSRWRGIKNPVGRMGYASFVYVLFIGVRRANLRQIRQPARVTDHG
jgi:hypothetical protein